MLEMCNDDLKLTYQKVKILEDDNSVLNEKYYKLKLE